MAYKLHYVCSAQGKRLAVIIPIRTWRSIEKKLKGIEFKEKLTKDLESAFEDVRLHQQGKIKLKTAREVLAEM